MGIFGEILSSACAGINSRPFRQLQHSRDSFGTMRHLLLQLTVVAATTAWPLYLDQLLDRLGRVYQPDAISILHSKGATRPGFVDALHRAISQNDSNYFRWLPKLIGNEESHGRFNRLTSEFPLFVIFAQHSLDPIINVQIMRSRNRRFCHTFFHFQHVESRQMIQNFFEHLWQRGFRSALVMVAGRRLYHMDPYPSVRVLRLKQTHDERKLFPIRDRTNFMGYKLRVPVQVDVPATFWYHRQYPESDKLQLDGGGGTLIREFMQHLNVCLELYPLYVNGSNNLNMPVLVNLLAEDRYELSPHQFTTLQYSDKVDYSYPYRVVQRCFMVPLVNTVPRALYIVKPLQAQTWLCLLLAIAVMLLMHNLAHRIRKTKTCINMLSLLGVSGCQPERKVASRMPFCFPQNLLIIGCLLFGISVLVQFYTTALTSMLAVTLTTKPFTMLDELFKHPFPIQVLRSDVDPIVTSFGHKKQFLRRFYFVDSNKFYANRVEMNPGYIYPLSTIRWNFINQQQRFMKHKRFWLSELCYGTFPYQFQLRSDSHFKYPLHFFELFVNEAGLHNHWESSWYRRAHEMGYVRDFTSLEHYKQMHLVAPMDLRLLATVFYLYILGIVVSVCTFVGEILYRKLSHNRSSY